MGEFIGPDQGNKSQTELEAAVEPQAWELEELKEQVLSTEADKQSFFKFLREVSKTRGWAWVQGAIAALILTSGTPGQTHDVVAPDWQKDSLTEAAPDSDAEVFAGAEEKITKKEFKEKLFSLFNTEDFVNTLVSGKLIEEIVGEAEARSAKGEVLVSVDGFMWTWRDKDGNETTSVIDLLEKNKGNLSEPVAESLDEYKAQLATEELEAKRKAFFERGLDVAGQRISEIYNEILESHDYEKVAPLDQAAIDNYLQAGYHLVKPLYDGLGQKVLGFSLTNIPANQEVYFELVSDEPIQEETGDTVNENSEEQPASVPGLIPLEEVGPSLAKAVQLGNLADKYFPAESAEVLNLNMDIIVLDRFNQKQYDEHAAKWAEIRGKMGQKFPELEELNKQIEKDMAGLHQMFEAEASIKEREEYVGSLGIHKQMEEAEKNIEPDSEAAAAFHLLKQTVTAEFRTAELWEVAKE